MMVTFWFSIAALTVMALAFVITPLLWVKKSSAPDEQKLAAQLYQQRLAELTKAFEQGELSAIDYQQSQAELARSLLQDAEKRSASTPKSYSHKSAGWLALIIIIILPIVAISYYLKSGASQQLAQEKSIQQKQQAIKKIAAQLGSAQHVIAVLKQHLAKDPNSARGWFLLGRLYLSTQQFDLAVDAFAKANQLQPQQTATLLSYVEALYLADDNQLNNLARDLLQQVLLHDPNNVNAINLLALDAYQQKHYQQAITGWEKLLGQLPPDSKDGQALLGMIADAQKQLAQQEKAVELVVHVAVTAEIKKQLQGNEVLFIFAQQPGQPMPLAVVRRKASDLPLTVTLNQQSVMVVTQSLADVKKVIIVARISRSGLPLPQAGDWQGESAIITMRQRPKITMLIIDKKL